MPRRPMVIDIPEQGGITSLLSGVTQGLTTGLMQQDENTRKERLRQQIYRDMLTRDSTNFQRSRDAAAQDYQRNRSDHLADVASGRSWQEQQSQTAEARKQAEEQAKKAEDMQQGQEYLRASGMGQPGEDYYLNPNSQPVVPSLGTRAAESLVTQKRMGEQAAAAQAERAIDNARQDKALGIAQQRADNAATQRGGQLSPDQMLSVAQDLADEYGIGLDEAIRKVRLRRSKMLAESQVKPDDTGQKMSVGAAQKEVEDLQETLKRFTGSYSSREMAAYAKDHGLASPDLARPHLVKRIEEAKRAAAAARQSIGATGRGSKPVPTFTYPPNLTPAEKDEYDRLMMENVDGRGP